MGNKLAVYALIRELSIKHNLYKITMESIQNYAKARVNGRDTDITTADIAGLDGILKELERDKKIKLEYIDNLVHRVVFNAYFIETIRNVYEQMKKDPHLPFPIPEMFKQEIPDDEIIAVDVKKEFVSFLESSETDSSKILRLVLPQFEYSLLVLPKMLGKELLYRAVDKIRSFLDKESNYDYIRSRVVAILKNEVDAVKKMMVSIKSHKEETIHSILNPTSFSFSFWSHLATSIIKEYQSKKSAYIGDYVYAQAAFLIGFYNVYYKGRSQKSSERESAYQQFRTKIRMEPYSFTFHDFYAFKNDNGHELIKTCGREEYNQFISKLITEEDEKGLPELVVIKTDSGKDHFIHRDLFFQYLLKQIVDVSEKYKLKIVDDWKESLEKFQKVPAMKSDSEFEKMVVKSLKETNPVLLKMLDYVLLMKIVEYGILKESQKNDLNLLLDFSQGCLKSYSEIFKLNRARLSADVRLLVPLYKSNSFFSGFVQFLARLFGGKEAGSGRHRREKKNSDMEFTKTSSDDFMVAVTNLKKDLVGEGGNIALSMDELVASWNPLLDKMAKANLVEDVNSMIRDYIRKIRRSFTISVPTRERVEEMADRLSGNSAFGSIKNKEALREYMVLYMISLLSNMKMIK